MLDEISIIIPCFNVEKYLEECLDSVFGQELNNATYTVICVNDGSADGTLDILTRYESSHTENMLVIYCEENRGQAYARNLGYSYSTGKYIVYVDSDDILEKNALQTLYDLISSDQYDHASCTFYTYGEGVERYDRKEQNFIYDSTTGNLSRLIADYITNNSVCARIYRKEFLDTEKIYFPENLYMEDIFFWSMCLITCKKCIFTGDIIYGYRQNYESTMHNRGLGMKAFDGYLVEELLCDELENRNILNDIRYILAPVYFLKAFVRPFESMGELTQDKIDMLKKVSASIINRFPVFYQAPYGLPGNQKVNDQYISLLHSL